MLLSPHVRESEIVMDSGFQVLDSGVFVRGTGIPDSKTKISGIPESGFPYM